MSQEQDFYSIVEEAFAKIMQEFGFKVSKRESTINNNLIVLSNGRTDIYVWDYFREMTPWVEILKTSLQGRYGRYSSYAFQLPNIVEFKTKGEKEIKEYMEYADEKGSQCSDEKYIKLLAEYTYTYAKDFLSGDFTTLKDIDKYLRKKDKDSSN
ncbi:MAG: hypothetical protein KAR42_14575 [candidate division Zixibacteria bacterium]|nr:hypothetical protein [candidate division Zixibacteria bacterium]